MVASVHSKLSMDAKEMTRRMVMAVASPHVDILGHCTGQKVPGKMRQIGKSDFPGRVGSQFDADMVFAACAKFDTAVEINCRPERQDPPDHLLDLALDWGCRIAIDTDAHAPGQLEFQAFGCDKAARHGIERRSDREHDAGRRPASSGPGRTPPRDGGPGPVAHDILASMDLIQYENEETLSREAAAAKLRELADQLSRHNQLAFDIDGLKTSVPVPNEVTMSIEIEIGDEGSELEIEINW